MPVEIPCFLEDYERLLNSSSHLFNDHLQSIPQAEVWQASTWLSETVDVSYKTFDNGTVPAADMDDPARQFLTGRDMTNLFEEYISVLDKYEGSTVDNFDRKFMLFLESCSQSRVSQKEIDLQALEHALKSHFITPKITHAVLLNWNERH